MTTSTTWPEEGAERAWAVRVLALEKMAEQRKPSLWLLRGPPICCLKVLSNPTEGGKGDDVIYLSEDPLYRAAS